MDKREDDKKSKWYRPAPAGHVYVCGACGKTSPTRSGWLSDTEQADGASSGWDMSCTMHAVLCLLEPVDGVWMARE